MDFGSLVIKKEGHEEYGFPIFIWGLFEKDNSIFYIINSEIGLNNIELKLRYPELKYVLPNHAKFRVIKDIDFKKKYSEIVNDSDEYRKISELLKMAYKVGNPKALINSAYAMTFPFYINQQVTSPEFVKTERLILKDKHSTITRLPADRTTKIAREQNLNNFILFQNVSFISYRFLVLKLIITFKELMASNYPSEDFPNKMFQFLYLGMFFNYYKMNKEKIGSININYLKKYPGEYQKLTKFQSIIEKFEEEILLFNKLQLNEEELRRELLSYDIIIPKDLEKENILMKLFEFDLAFWQKLLLLEIVDDMPVAKPYKNGISESYNYMLLLPYFQWIAPHYFPTLKAAKISNDNYQKNMVARMKNFVAGKIS